MTTTDLSNKLKTVTANTFEDAAPPGLTEYIVWAVYGYSIIVGDDSAQVRIPRVQIDAYTQAADPRGTGGFFEHHERTVYIYINAVKRLLHAFGHSDHCRQMKDVIHIFHGAGKFYPVTDIAADKLNIQTFQIFHAAAAEIVQDNDFSFPIVILGNVAADKTCSPGYKYTH